MHEDCVFDDSDNLHHVQETSNVRIVDFLWGDNKLLYVTQEEISLRATSFPEDNCLDSVV